MQHHFFKKSSRTFDEFLIRATHQIFVKLMRSIKIDATWPQLKLVGKSIQEIIRISKIVNNFFFLFSSIISIVWKEIFQKLSNPLSFYFELNRELDSIHFFQFSSIKKSIFQKFLTISFFYSVQLFKSLKKKKYSKDRQRILYLSISNLIENHQLYSLSIQFSSRNNLYFKNCQQSKEFNSFSYRIQLFQSSKKKYSKDQLIFYLSVEFNQRISQLYSILFEKQQ